MSTNEPRTAAAPLFGASWLAQDAAEVGQIEALGFDSVWVGEHLAHPTVVTMDALVTLGAMAARTTSLRLGSGVVLLPLRHPAITAKAAATVDALSGGRLILGVGVGGEYPEEFAVAGVPLAERGRRTDEAIAVMRGLWSGVPVPHEGTYWQVPAVALAPRPVRDGGPPIWIGGRSAAAARRAGRLGDGFLPLFCDPAGYGLRMGWVDAAAEASGRDPDAIVRGLFQFICVDDRRERASRRAVDQLGRFYQQDFSALVERFCLLGTPEQCADRLSEYLDQRAHHVVLVPIGAPDRASRLEQVEAYARHVIPGLRSAYRVRAGVASGGSSG